MGVFDWYEPMPEVRCPFCEFVIDEWQGKDGPCALLVWRQGSGSPVAQSVDAEAVLDADDMSRWTLPERFEFLRLVPK